MVVLVILFQSTQPEWAATEAPPLDRVIAVQISIHAARMGCDDTRHGFTYSATISIHAARMGCDILILQIVNYPILFQSTQPEWAATSIPRQFWTWVKISIHAARMGCDGVPYTGIGRAHLISIHAARMGCDRRKPCSYLSAVCDFNPRSPNGLRRAWRAVCKRNVYNFNPRSPNGLRLQTLREQLTVSQISIHAARMGCDINLPYAFSNNIYFNPRSPNGLRRYNNSFRKPRRLFQSTQPEWAATRVKFRWQSTVHRISIHAARMGCDGKSAFNCQR